MRKRDWRIWFGIVVTLVWVGGGGWYVFGVMRADATNQLSPEALGSFLEGAFAPLAFLWLVIGLFIQQRELANNSKAIRKASKQSEKQTAAIAATEMNARQETFFKIAENVRNQLGGITGMLFISCFGATEGQLVPRDRIAEMWHMLARRDDQVFGREFLLLDADDYGGYRSLFYKTKIRRRHTKNFMRTFARLMVMAKECDADNGIIADSLAQTAHGLIYNRMIAARPDDLHAQNASVDTSDYEKVLELTRD